VNVEERVELARYTTLGTGGPASVFARPRTIGEVEELLRLAAERGLDVATVGLGSNLLVADRGVDALVLKLDGAVAAATVDGCCAPAAARRTRSSSIGRGTRASGASSSPARSRARSAAASG
jgi:hypothetical protein